MPTNYTREQRLAFAKELGILVDQQDEWLLEEYTWRLNSGGYPVTWLPVQGEYYYVSLHHMIMGHPIWKGEEVDHRDRQPTNNSRDNLRMVTHAQNMQNKTLTVGETGEHRIIRTTTERYLLRIARNGTRHYLGTFDTLDEAVTKRNDWLTTNGG